jgi:hypothetical protein
MYHTPSPTVHDDKVYSGKVVAGRAKVVVQSELGLKPLRCLDFFGPSFSWGFHGGAADELAIAILHDHFGLTSTVVGSRIRGLYHAFVDEVVSKLSRARTWTLDRETVEQWVVRHERGQQPLAPVALKVF